MERKRILVVEDDPDQLLGMKLRLEASGYEVKMATSVKSALEVAAEAKPDAIILDLGLPDGHGFDLLKRFESLEATRCTPVIILTASEARDNLARSFESDRVVTYLQKPAEPAELLKTLELALK